jgi:hypothetical protein
VILDKAITYIAELKKQTEEVSQENAGLRLIINGGSHDRYLYANGVRRKGVARGHITPNVLRKV